MHIKIKKMSRGFITVFTKARHFSLHCAKKKTVHVLFLLFVRYSLS